LRSKRAVLKYSGMVGKNSKTRNEKILVIEANKSFGEDVMAALKAAGYAHVSLKTDGASGLAAIYDLPHLVLLDISLSDIDGYKVLAKKQSEQLLAKIPVFLLSAEGVPINMRDIPKGSVAEVIISLHASAGDIVEKVDHYFGHEGDAGEDGQGGAGGAKIKLLWVEDDKLIGTILAKKLMSSGFDLRHAQNGEEALNMIAKEKPDAIVVDLLLPGMSGFEILQKIQGDESLKKVPKMVLSNLSKSSDIDRARSLGAEKFLVKASTSLDQIVAEVKAMVK